MRAKTSSKVRRFIIGLLMVTLIVLGGVFLVMHSDNVPDSPTCLVNSYNLMGRVVELTDTHLILSENKPYKIGVDMGQETDLQGVVGITFYNSTPDHPRPRLIYDLRSGNPHKVELAKLMVGQQIKLCWENDFISIAKSLPASLNAPAKILILTQP